MATVPELIFYMWGAIGGFFGKLFGRGGSPTERVAWAQMAGGQLSHLFENTTDLSDLLTGTAAACVSVRASERSIIQFIVREYKNETPLSAQLQNLLDNPSPIISRCEFIELCSSRYDCDGNVPILLVSDDRGVPVEQWLLPSGAFNPHFDNTNNPIPDAWTWLDGRSSSAPSELILIRRQSNKTGPYKGSGILADALSDLRLQSLLQKAQENYFRTGGAPNVALSFPLGAGIAPEQAAAYQALWANKYNPATGSTNIGIIPDGGTVVNFGTQELNFNDSRAAIKASIREAFQVPRILLGDTDNVNHNNGQTAIAIFERTVVLRFAQKFAEAYQNKFRELFHPFITVEVAPMLQDSFTHLTADNAIVIHNEAGN